MALIILNSIFITLIIFMVTINERVSGLDNYEPYYFPPNHRYINGKNNASITIPCNPDKIDTDRTATLHKILSISGNPIEKITVGNGREFGSVSYTNTTGYTLSNPIWSVNNTRLLCLFSLRSGLDYYIGRNLTLYLKFYVNTTDINIGIDNINIDTISPNNTKVIEVDFGDTSVVQLNLIITKPNMNYIDLTWTKDDNDILFDVYSNYKSKVLQNKVQLELSDLSLDDSGIYTLTARTINSTLSVEWKLAVASKAKVEITLSGNQYFFSTGQQYTISCDVIVAQITPFPKIWWYSSQCDDPINTECMGDHNKRNRTGMVTKSNAEIRKYYYQKLHNGYSSAKMGKYSKYILYAITSSIDVIAFNYTYECAVEHIWGFKQNHSENIVDQKLMIALNESQKNLSREISAGVYMISGGKASLNTWTEKDSINFICSAVVSMYAKDITYYYSDFWSNRLVNITKNATYEKYTPRGFVTETQLRYYNILNISNARHGNYTCKLRKRGTDQYDQYFYILGVPPVNNNSFSVFNGSFSSFLIIFCVIGVNIFV